MQTARRKPKCSRVELKIHKPPKEENISIDCWDFFIIYGSFLCCLRILIENAAAPVLTQVLNTFNFIARKCLRRTHNFTDRYLLSNYYYLLLCLLIEKMCHFWPFLFSNPIYDTLSALELRNLL